MTRAAFALCLLISFASAAAGNAKKNQGGNSQPHPKGPVEQYRHDNEICPEWSDLDMLTSCKLKVGSRIVVGPGQSAKCATKHYPKSAVNQVFVPNDGRAGVFHVENCSKAVAWP